MSEGTKRAPVVPRKEGGGEDDLDQVLHRIAKIKLGSPTREKQPKKESVTKSDSENGGSDARTVAKAKRKHKHGGGKDEIGKDAQVQTPRTSNAQNQTESVSKERSLNSTPVLARSLENETSVNAAEHPKKSNGKPKKSESIQEERSRGSRKDQDSHPKLPDHGSDNHVSEHASALSALPDKDTAVRAAMEALRQLSLSTQASKTCPPLRDYQQHLVDTIVERFNKGTDSLLMYLPTGAGKTAVALSIARALKTKRVAMFVHKDELAYQLIRAANVWGYSESDVGLLKAESSPTDEQPLVVVSIQTFARRYLGSSTETSILPPDFSLIIIDEAHHAMANEYREMIKLYSKSLVLGVTATPFRLKKGEILGDIFNDRVDGPSIDSLIKAKWLVPPAFVRSSQSRGALGKKAARDPQVLRAIVSSFKMRGLHESRKTIAFCMDIGHAKDLCKAFEEAGIEARILTGKTKAQERDRLFAMSREGDLSVICSVDVVSEGVDTVWVDCLLLLRPSQSRSLFIQQVGRGLRPFIGKSECIILDEIGNVFRHGFIHDVSSSENGPAHKVRVFDCVQHTKCLGLVDRPGKLCVLCMNGKESKSSPPMQDSEKPDIKLK